MTGGHLEKGFSELKCQRAFRSEGQLSGTRNKRTVGDCPSRWAALKNPRTRTEAGATMSKYKSRKKSLMLFINYQMELLYQPSEVAAIGLGKQVTC